MRTAVISDVHANLEALRVVMDHIDSQEVDRIICLGDILGYGPSPVDCVEIIAERCEWSLMGNHDFGVVYEPTNFNLAAEQAAYWSREQFEHEANRERAAVHWEFLSRLRVRVGFDGFLCVHGTPRRPINEYLFPEDALNSPVRAQLSRQDAADLRARRPLLPRRAHTRAGRLHRRAGLLSAGRCRRRLQAP
ncbi:MAG: metallophosphoesterase family protein [Planctomycetota bacterium]